MSSSKKRQRQVSIIIYNIKNRYYGRDNKSIEYHSNKKSHSMSQEPKAKPQEKKEQPQETNVNLSPKNVKVEENKEPNGKNPENQKIDEEQPSDFV